MEQIIRVNQKKEYDSPVAEIVLFEKQDIVLTAISLPDDDFNAQQNDAL